MRVCKTLPQDPYRMESCCAVYKCEPSAKNATPTWVADEWAVRGVKALEGGRQDELKKSNRKDFMV